MTKPIELPAPAGFRTRYRSEPGMIGHYPWSYADHSRRRVDRPEHEYEDLYTAEQVRACAEAAVAAQAAELEALRADAERLDWLFRQDLDDLVLQLVRDTYHDGEYCVHGDDGALGYGKTPREAIDAARAALKEQKT